MRPTYDDLVCLLREGRRAEAQHRILDWLKGKATMSWNTSVPATKASAFLDAVDAANLPDYPGSETHYNAEMRDALAAAKAAVKALYESSVLGALSAAGDELYFAASMSGHANPGHVPAAGWSNDFISISVSQVDAPKEG
jgi:hypothetical protein